MPEPADPTSPPPPSGTHGVWQRLELYFDLKKGSTRAAYLSVFREWCGFIGVEPGTEPGARGLLAADDLAAGRYRMWLSERLGQKPRQSGGTSREAARPGRKKRAIRPREQDGTSEYLTNSTIGKKLVLLRRVYHHLAAHYDEVRRNPFDPERVPPPPRASGRKRPTEMVSFEKVRAVLEAPPAHTTRGVRDRAILGLLFGAGLRRSEVSRLRLADVRKTPKGTWFLSLRATKSGKDSTQALPKWAGEQLSVHLRERKRQGARPSDFVFIGFRGRGGAVPGDRISDSGIYKLFKHYCRAAGAGEFLTPHSARATAITKLLSDGVSHREVQEFSRHASVQMVELYDKRRLDIEDNPAKGLEYE